MFSENWQFQRKRRFRRQDWWSEAKAKGTRHKLKKNKVLKEDDCENMFLRADVQEQVRCHLKPLTTQVKVLACVELRAEMIYRSRTCRLSCWGRYSLFAPSSPKHVEEEKSHNSFYDEAKTSDSTEQPDKTLRLTFFLLNGGSFQRFSTATWPCWAQVKAKSLLTYNT